MLKKIGMGIIVGLVAALRILFSLNQAKEKENDSLKRSAEAQKMATKNRIKAAVFNQRQQQKVKGVSAEKALDELDKKRGDIKDDKDDSFTSVKL